MRPKSLNVARAVDAYLGVGGSLGGPRSEAHAGWIDRGAMRGSEGNDGWQRPWMDDEAGVNAAARVYLPGSAEARRWAGHGTALKPAYEPIVVARKPLVGTVAANVLAYGTGAMNIDGCRVDAVGRPARQSDPKPEANGAVYAGRREAGHGFDGGSRAVGETSLGRWPPNVVFSHHPDCRQVGERRVKGSVMVVPEMGRRSGIMGERAPRPDGGTEFTHADADGMETVAVYECVPGCPVAELDAQSGVSGPKPPGSVVKRENSPTSASIGKESRPPGTVMVSYGDSGGASRFFPVFKYQPKAARSERDEGLPPTGDGKPANRHPTVKPVELMRWLIRLVTPEGGTVLDPFTGSGTTGMAAAWERRRFVGIEKNPDYAERIAVPRIGRAVALAAETGTQGSLFD